MRFAVIAAVTAASGCVTLHSGTTQRIRVASTPPDAQVFLDGQLVGATPLDVTVSRRNRRPMLVIEKDGFPRHERRLRRSETWRVLDSFGIGVGLTWVSGALLVGGRERGLSFWETMAVGGIGAAPSVIDYLTGAVFAFPDRIDVDLAPKGPEWWLRVPERGPRLHEPAGLRERLSKSLSASPPGFEAAAQQAVGAVEPLSHVPLRDVEAVGQPPRSGGPRCPAACTTSRNASGSSSMAASSRHRNSMA